MDQRKKEAKRRTDQMVIMRNTQQGDKVLDLGCGRGSLLELLTKEKRVQGVGVDNNPYKILECIRKGITAYQGDINSVLGLFPDQSFDRVVLSRTIEHLSHSGNTITEAIRVGKRVTIGFVNHGFWINRMNYLLKGNRTVNDVYPDPWHDTSPLTPFSLANFEVYCRKNGIQIHECTCLDGEWKNPCTFLPNLLAGYVICDISR